MAYKLFYISALSLILALPAVGHADEAVTDSDDMSEGFYSGLEEFSLRRDISGLSHYYFVQPKMPPDAGEESGFQDPSIYPEGSSAGGYVSLGTPTTSTFFGSVPEEQADTLIDGVEFGMGWRPDVSASEKRGHRRMGRGLAGSEIDRVGVRADLTAMLNDDSPDNAGGTAWRVTGMLGSTSLSLLSDDGASGLDTPAENSGLLWDIGVGWSSGAMSVNAGYQSAYSLDEAIGDESAIAVFSLGADYAILPGLSVYGEFNLIDGPTAENVEGLGTVVVVGTGVSF